jgi:tetratricopeptide (TPR) repeat protein
MTMVWAAWGAASYGSPPDIAVFPGNDVWPAAEALALLDPPPPGNPANTARLVSELTSDDPATRDRATDELDAKGADAFPGLRHAVAASHSTELELRATPALDDDRFKIPPKTPERTRQAIAAYQKQHDMALALTLKSPAVHLDPILPLVEGLNDFQGALFFQIVPPQENNPALHEFLLAQAAHQARQTARLDIAQGKLDEAQRVLLAAHTTYGAAQDYVVLRALRAGPWLNVDQEMKAIPASHPQRKLIRAEFLRAAGNFAGAAQIARDLPLGSQSFARQMMVEAGMYGELAAYDEAQPRRLPSDVDAELCELLLGDAHRAKTLLDSRAGNAGVNPRVMSGDLLRVDRVPEALAHFTKQDRISAFHLLCYQLKVREALAQLTPSTRLDLDVPEHLLALGLPQAAQDALTRTGAGVSLQQVAALSESRPPRQDDAAQGDAAMAQGDFNAAAKLYRRAAVVDLMNPALMYRLGVGLSRMPQTQQDGRRLMDYAPLLVLADDQAAAQLAELDRRFDVSPDPQVWLADYDRRYGGAPNVGTALAALRNAAEARGDLADALTLQKKLLFWPGSASEHPYDDAIAPAIAWAHYHRLRALAALRSSDAATLADALDRELDDGPPDVALLQNAAPFLEQAEPAAWDGLLRRAIERLHPVVQDYPAATAYHRQLQALEALR